MNKPTIAFVLAAAIAGGLWLGHSPKEDVRAEPIAVERVERRAMPTHRPTLPSRAPARGLAADLVAADPKVRRAAVVDVARSDQPDPQTLLVASRDPDLDVARAALAGVGKLYADGQISAKDMVSLAGDRTLSDRARIAALNGLGTIASPEAATLLVKLLASGNPLERRSAAALLGNQDPEVAIPALITALGDEDEHVRSNAHESLKLRSRGRDFGLDGGPWQAWWQARR